MTQAKLTAEYMQGAFDAQAAQPDATKLEAYASSLQAVLRAARPGFEALEFEAEPAAFRTEQGRHAP